jgi:fatty acid desaturase
MNVRRQKTQRGRGAIVQVVIQTLVVAGLYVAVYFALILSAWWPLLASFICTMLIDCVLWHDKLLAWLSGRSA